MKLSKEDIEEIDMVEKASDNAKDLMPFLRSLAERGELEKIPAAIDYFSSIVKINGPYIKSYLAHRAPAIVVNHWPKEEGSLKPIRLAIVEDDGWSEAVTNAIMRGGPLVPVAKREFARIEDQLTKEKGKKQMNKANENRACATCGYDRTTHEKEMLDLKLRNNTLALMDQAPHGAKLVAAFVAFFVLCIFGYSGWNTYVKATNQTVYSSPAAEVYSSLTEAYEACLASANYGSDRVGCNRTFGEAQKQVLELVEGDVEEPTGEPK